ncbi:hypothetical protein FP2506_01843 [Fulvimarina pelagi HTCC2506]|uniref:Uncharacterized protein n=1 Tax=Fulvimarina pelagi HTCC2506 TaxID=314231 RepID=Q0FXG6_9HYPH|nr:hypothetical protein FP2506_01843 [Fulvimarina pelagi HTCC2506]
MGVSEIRRLKQLENEDGKLQRLVSDLTLRIGGGLPLVTLHKFDRETFPPEFAPSNIVNDHSERAPQHAREGPSNNFGP